MKWQARHTSLLVIALGFGLLYFLFHKEWMLTPVGMAFVGFFIKSIGEFIHIGWMMIAKVLGWINSRILLSVLYYVILTPVALVARLFGKAGMRKLPGNATTTFVTRNHRYTKEDLQHPW